MEPGSDKIDVRNKDDVAKRMTAAVASKQYGQEEILCPLIAEVRLRCSFNVRASVHGKSGFQDTGHFSQATSVQVLGAYSCYCCLPLVSRLKS